MWKKNNIEQHEESKNTVMLHEGEYSKTITRTRERSGTRARERSGARERERSGARERERS